jgi:hypothetical protein
MRLVELPVNINQARPEFNWKSIRSRHAIQINRDYTSNLGTESAHFKSGFSIFKL